MPTILEYECVPVSPVQSAADCPTSDITYVSGCHGDQLQLFVAHNDPVTNGQSAHSLVGSSTSPLKAVDEHPIGLGFHLSNQLKVPDTPSSLLPYNTEQNSQSKIKDIFKIFLKAEGHKCVLKTHSVWLV